MADFEASFCEADFEAPTCARPALATKRPAKLPQLSKENLTKLERWSGLSLPLGQKRPWNPTPLGLWAADEMAATKLAAQPAECQWGWVKDDNATPLKRSLEGGNIGGCSSFRCAHA